MSVSVRHATARDHEPIVAFQKAMAWETEGLELDASNVDRGVQQILLGNAPGFYLIAEIKEEVVGCVMVNPEWSDWSGKVQLWLNSIYVLPEYRRMGILRALFNFVVENSSPETHVRIKLYVDRHNERAVEAYKAMRMTEQHYRMLELPI